MLYGLLRIIFTFVYSVIFPTTVKGKENIPKEGAVILAANHLSNRSEERRVGKECRSRWSPYH